MNKQFVIYDPERNMFVVVPMGYDLEFDQDTVFMTHIASCATNFSEDQLKSYIDKHKAKNPWLIDRSEFREVN
jgi:hypothetical protein